MTQRTQRVFVAMSILTYAFISNGDHALSYHQLRNRAWPQTDINHMSANLRIKPYYYFRNTVLDFIPKTRKLHEHSNRDNYYTQHFYGYHQVVEQTSKWEVLLNHASKEIQNFQNKIHKTFQRVINLAEQELLTLSDIYNRFLDGLGLANDETTRRWTLPMAGLATFLLLEARVGTITIENIDSSTSEFTCGGIICNPDTSNVCSNNICVCGGTGKECSGGTPVCLEPVILAGGIPATPKLGSTTATCQCLVDKSCNSVVAGDICCQTDIVSVEVSLIGTCGLDELTCTGA